MNCSKTVLTGLTTSWSEAYDLHTNTNPLIYRTRTAATLNRAFDLQMLILSGLPCSVQPELFVFSWPDHMVMEALATCTAEYGLILAGTCITVLGGQE